MITQRFPVARGRTSLHALHHRVPTRWAFQTAITHLQQLIVLVLLITRYAKHAVVLLNLSCAPAAPSVAG